MKRKALSVKLRKIIPVSLQHCSICSNKASSRFFSHISYNVMMLMLSLNSFPPSHFPQSFLSPVSITTNIFDFQVQENRKKKKFVCIIFSLRLFMSNSYKILIKLSLMSPMTIHQIMFLIILCSPASPLIWTFMFDEGLSDGFHEFLFRIFITF